MALIMVINYLLWVHFLKLLYTIMQSVKTLVNYFCRSVMYISRTTYFFHIWKVTTTIWQSGFISCSSCFLSRCFKVSQIMHDNQHRTKRFKLGHHLPMYSFLLIFWVLNVMNKSIVLNNASEGSSYKTFKRYR